MATNNEWDKLKTVIVGIADDAAIPPMDISLRTINFADIKSTKHKANAIFNLSAKGGKFPEQVVEEANEDLEIFCDFLRKEDVKVLRPDKNIVPKYYNYCPRDTVLSVGDKLLAAPMSITSRETEYLSMAEHFVDRNLIVAPIPERKGLYNLDCINDPNILAMNETAPAFDAANVLKANDDLFYLVSNTGNKKGAEYLQSVFPDKKVHTVENVYSFIHIDSTIALLREGLLMIQPWRVKSLDMLPEPLRSWDVIRAPQPYDIGTYPGYKMSSPWINVNLFNVRPDLVVLEEHQHETRKLIEKYKIDVAMLPMRHARTLGGCFHCVTLDLDREP
jgi:N-dimethylarginine dimethylaminohydrolase